MDGGRGSDGRSEEETSSETDLGASLVCDAVEAARREGALDGPRCFVEVRFARRGASA